MRGFLSSFPCHTEGPALRVFWDLEKTVLHEICVRWTVLWSPSTVQQDSNDPPQK